MHSQCTRLFAADSAEGFGVVRFASSPEGHGGRKTGSAIDAVAEANLEVRRDQQRQLRVTLQPVEQIRRFIGAAPIEKWRLIGHTHRK